MIISIIRFLGIAAASGAALGQPAAEDVPVESEQRLLAQIEHVRAEQGSTAEGLIAPLRGLALLHQEAGEHTSAIIALQEARQIVRARHGLFSATVEEAELLRQQIRSEKALGTGDRAWGLQQELVTIAQQHYDDMRMLPIFVELIDDRTALLDEFRATDFAELRPGIYVPCTPLGGEQVVVMDARACPFGTWRLVVERLSREILQYYAEAIEVLVVNGDYASRELRDLEKEALRRAPFIRTVSCRSGTIDQLLASELIGRCLEPIGHFGPITFGNVGGWATLMRLVVYEIRSGAPAAARANAFAELADWYLWYAQNDNRSFNEVDELALKLYARAFAELRLGDDARESMARIFSPELPVMLPTHAPNPLASTESSRYIEVAFAITKSGRAEQIEILAASEDATRREQRDLIRSLEYASFRPRAVDGELADSAPVVVRYYLPENPVSTAGSARQPPSGRGQYSR
ncbi:MAG TPA: hypothetical protein VIC71_11915 [Gammaproteobacteria bacterium]